MKRTTLYHLAKFIIALLFTTLFIIRYTVHYGFLAALVLTLLTWTFFMLCTPLNKGGMLVAPILYFTTHHRFQYTELAVWLAAIAMNALAIFSYPMLYTATTITSLLYYILTHPWPCWVIVALSLCATLYNIFAIWTAPRSVRMATIAMGILLKLSVLASLYAFAYKPTVIIINTHGLM